MIPPFENAAILPGTTLEFFNTSTPLRRRVPEKPIANNPHLEGSSFNANSELSCGHSAKRLLRAIAPLPWIRGSTQKFEPVRTVMTIVSEVSFRLGALSHLKP